MNELTYDYKPLPPFKWFVLQNFPFIEADFDALTNWELMCKLGNEINKLIDSQNMTGEQIENLTNAFNSLKDYVDNYFDNLDVQEEINAKLDEMAENGEFDEYFKSFLSENLDEIKVTEGNTTAYILKVPFVNQNNVRNTLKVGIAFDQDIPNNREDPLEFSKRKNASALINGGLTDTETGKFLGNNLMMNGQDLVSVTTEHFYTLGIKNDGTLTAYAPTVTKQEIIADGCENTIGGYYPIIINNNYPDTEIIAELGESWDTLKYPRSIIAQTEDKTVYLLTCSGKDVNGESGLTYKECADILMNIEPIKFAYALDGGGSATLLHRGTMLNVPTDSNGRDFRKLHSMIYISNEIVSQHDKDINYLDYISGKNKRATDMNKALIPYVNNIQDGTLNLLNPEDVTYQGINVYEDGDRITKLNLQENKISYFNYDVNKAIFDFDISQDRMIFNGLNLAKIYELLENSTVTDLDEVTKTGFYFAPTSNTVLNKPVSTRAYHFIVLGSTSSDGYFVHQIALPFTPNESIYYRFHRLAGWDAWKQIAFNI